MADNDRQVQAQLPAPQGALEDPAEHLERLPPGKQGHELMARHLREEHDYADFELARDVHLGGPRSKGQHLTWNTALRDSNR